MPDEPNSEPRTEPAHATEARASAVRCPSCGGENHLASGDRLLRCEFCDATLFVDRSGLVGHYFLPRLLDREQAEAALKRWMAGNDTVKDLDSKSQVTSIEAISFPVWMFRSRQGGDETVDIEPAAATPIPQLADLEIPAGRLEPFREEEAPRIGVTVPLATARGWLEERGVRDVHESSLVQLPLWRASYSHEDSSYEALIDGSTGKVLVAVFPEKAEAPYLLVAALGFALFGIAGIVISNPLIKFVVFAVLTGPLVLLAYWVTRKV